MTKKDLDELEDIFYNGSDEEHGIDLLNNIGINFSIEMLEDASQIYKLIAEKIEKDQDLVEYLKTKPSSFICSIAQFFSKEIIKQFVEERDKYGFNSDEITALVAGTKDSQYIDYVLKHEEDYNLNGDNKQQLDQAKIIGNDDPKKVIESLKGVEFQSHNIVGIALSLGEPEYLKSLIEKHKEYNLYDLDIYALAGATNDKEYIKSIVEKRQEYSLSNFSIISIIEKTNDVQYIKNIIERKDEFDFYGEDITDLVIATGDTEYMKRAIEKRDEYNFSSTNIIDIAIATGDTQYMKTMLEKKMNLE